MACNQFSSMIMIVPHRDDNEITNDLFGLSSTILILQS